MDHVVLDHVHLSYGNVPAISDVKLQIPKGSFFTLLGPSGCGKTSTLRVIGGFITPDKGDVYIDGERVTDLPPEKRGTGMVFQNYALFPHMRVNENIGFGLKMRGCKRAEIDERVQKISTMMRLEGLVQRYPREISGGQQQRVALARALVIEPRVLLLDEPLSNLDLKLRLALRSELRNIHKRLGITTIFVTHDQGEALSLSTHIAVMNQGSVIQIGTPSEIYESPKSQFVAQFIGDANLIKGRVSSQEAECIIVDLGSQQITAGPSSLDEKSPGTDVTLVIRPQRIQVTKEKQSNYSYPATIEEALYEGAAITYRAKVGTAVLTIEGENLGQDHHKVGESVFLTILPTNVLVWSTDEL